MTYTPTKYQYSSQNTTPTYKPKNIHNKHSTHSSNPKYLQPQPKTKLHIKHRKYLKILHPTNKIPEHKLKHLSPPHLKYQPHPKNTTASAYRPRHINNNVFHFINIRKPNSITSPNSIHNTKSHFSPKQI